MLKHYRKNAIQSVRVGSKKKTTTKKRLGKQKRIVEHDNCVCVFVFVKKKRGIERQVNGLRNFEEFI